MNKIENSPDFLGMASRLKEDMRNYASVEAVEFFKSSFDNQGFTDMALDPWPNRSNDLSPGRAILVNTTYLRDSIRVLNSNEEQIVFGTDAPYSQIHNEGGTVNIMVTAKSRKFFWFMYKSTKDEKWKAMALTKKDKFSFKMPKRQFIGESQTLMGDLDSWLNNQILTRFKNL